MESVRASAARALACLLITASAASGQSAAESSAHAASSTVLHANSNLVLVDVTVMDHGKPVHGLDRSRFHISEDGHEKVIAAFDEHQPHAAPPDVESTKAELAALPPRTVTNLPLYPDTGAINVLLLDALNTPVASQADGRAQFIEFLSTIKPGTPFAIFTLTNRLRLIEGFTMDPARLAAAFKNNKTLPSQSIPLEEQKSEKEDLEQEIARREELPVKMKVTIDALKQFENDETTAKTGERVRMTLEAFSELARYLGAIPGRKNLLWFSGSFPITLDPDPHENSWNAGRNVESYANQIRRTDDLLTASRVAVYPIDDRGWLTSPNVDATYEPTSSSVLHAGQSLKDADSNFLTQNSEEHDTLSIIAEETGGRAFYNTNDLKNAVAEAVEDGASFYTIAYDPGAEKQDGSFRRIKVSVNGGNYKLAYRDGYYADRGPAEHGPNGSGLVVSAILHGAPPSTQIVITARVLPSTDAQLKDVALPNGPAGQMATGIKGPRHLYVVDLGADSHSLTFIDLPDGDHAAKIGFILVAYDADGTRVNYQDQTMEITLKPKQYDVIMAQGLRARMFIDLPQSPGYLRVAVQDVNADRVGSLEVPVSVAK
jgi:VWFA-related protein